MTTEACAIPRAKEFKYRVEFNGLPVSLCAEFDPGERTHGVTEHMGAGQNFACKEVGHIKFANAHMKMVVPLEGEGRDFWESWMDQAQDPSTGNGGMPANYRRNFSMYELKPDGNPSRVWEFYGAFPVSYKPGNRSSQGDKDVIDDISIAYAWREMRLL